jgi:uncharacterized protein (TIGR02271 family)
MNLKDVLRTGMRVVGPDDREYGTIDRYDDAAVYVRGKRVPFSAIARADRDHLYVQTPDRWQLGDSPSPDMQLGGETRIPLLEEQLAFATREIDLGEIRVHKTVEQAEEVRSGQLNREDVEVQRIRVDRRVTEPEVSRQEGDWLIIPVMEEVFVVEKHLMVTEEIRIRKQLVTEDAEVRETVRRERATVEDTRVPRAPLLAETAMRRDRQEPRPGPVAADESAPPEARAQGDDAAWEQLHREIRDAGR